METMETMESFEARVLARTGLTLEEIPEGEPGDIIGGHIFVRHGGLYVVGTGYPDRDEETGEEMYSAFVRVQL